MPPYFSLNIGYCISSKKPYFKSQGKKPGNCNYLVVLIILDNLTILFFFLVPPFEFVTCKFNLFNRYGISGFPTIKFFPKDNKDGEEVITSFL